MRAALLPSTFKSTLSAVPAGVSYIGVVVPMWLCELCDRPLPTAGRCGCQTLGGACDAVSAFGAYRALRSERAEPTIRRILHRPKVPAR